MKGLSAVGELSPGNLYTPPSTQVFTALIRTLAANFGYDSSSMIAVPYDWRLSPKQVSTKVSFAAGESLLTDPYQNTW